MKRRKSFFLDLFPGSMTWEYSCYRGLQGVIRGDRGDMGLKVITRGYRGLQVVTRGYSGLQWVTRGYRGLQRIIETFF